MTAWSDYSPSDQERAKAAYMKYLNMQHDIEDFKLSVYDKEWCLGWLAVRRHSKTAMQNSSLTQSRVANLATALWRNYEHL